MWTLPIKEKLQGIDFQCFGPSQSCTSSSNFDDNISDDFGMIPIAIAKGAAAEMNNGLALVLIGGLLSSLFLTLIIVPVVYSIFDGLINRFGKSESIDIDAQIKADYVNKDVKDI